MMKKPILSVIDENGNVIPIRAIQGQPGITPHIGENGNWWIGDADTGVSAGGTVKSVNGELPDEKGNVQIELPSGGITQETDPTVPDWAKQPKPPKYTAEDVGAATVHQVEQLSKHVDDAIANHGVWYGTTSTASHTAEKAVTTTTGDFQLVRGAVVAVKFLNKIYNCNSLIVDGTTITYIKSSNDENGTLSTNSPTLWENKGGILWFVYDGEYFIVTDGNAAGETTVGLVTLKTIRDEAAKSHYTKTEIDTKFTALDTALAAAIGSGVVS